MAQPDHQAARQYALERLQKELSPALTYHSIFHTREMVMRSAEAFARIEGLPQEQADLLVTAAAFHDIGYLKKPTDHESAGACIAQEVLPSFGFSMEQVNQVVGMIQATHLPQTPLNHLEELMADADLSILGMEDFLKLNSSLRLEQAQAGRVYTDEEWYSSQARFMQNHHYFSTTAQALYAEGKQKNMAVLEQLLAKIPPVAT
ncbi:MAG TPA: HD domain-containing protein [Anaerolineaceae bacterium]